MLVDQPPYPSSDIAAELRHILVAVARTSMDVGQLPGICGEWEALRARQHRIKGGEKGLELHCELGSETLIAKGVDGGFDIVDSVQSLAPKQVDHSKMAIPKDRNLVLDAGQRALNVFVRIGSERLREVPSDTVIVD